MIWIGSVRSSTPTSSYDVRRSTRPPPTSSSPVQAEDSSSRGAFDFIGQIDVTTHDGSGHVADQLVMDAGVVTHRLEGRGRVHTGQRGGIPGRLLDHHTR